MTMTMSRRGVLKLAIALVAVQAAALLIYRAVESGRGQGLLVESSESTANTPRDALAPGRPRVLHFWATWCAPCIRELPAFLDFARAAAPRAELLAISLDADWPTLRRHFPQGIPPEVVRARDLDGPQALGVTTLPHTLVLGAAGRIEANLPGERDWAAPETRAAVLQPLGP